MECPTDTGGTFTVDCVVMDGKGRMIAEVSAVA